MAYRPEKTPEDWQTTAISMHKETGKNPEIYGATLSLASLQNIS